MCCGFLGNLKPVTSRVLEVLGSNDLLPFEVVAVRRPIVVTSRSGPTAFGRCAEGVLMSGSVFIFLPYRVKIFTLAEAGR